MFPRISIDLFHLGVSPGSDGEPALRRTVVGHDSIIGRLHSLTRMSHLSPTLVKRAYSGPLEGRLASRLAHVATDLARLQANLQTGRTILARLVADSTAHQKRLDVLHREWKGLSRLPLNLQMAAQAAIAVKAEAVQSQHAVSLVKAASSFNRLSVPGHGLPADRPRAGSFRDIDPGNDYIGNPDVQDLHQRNMLRLEAAIADATGAKRAKLEHLKKRIEEQTRLTNDLFLLKFDPSGDGRVVMSTGNPYTADNVQIFVPGVNSSLKDTAGDPGKDSGGNLDRVLDIRNRMDSLSKGSSAVVFYLDYDPPNVLDVSTQGLLTPEPISQDFANNFVPFVRGLEAANPSSRLTVNAHSFGSFAAAYAIEKYRLPIDGLALVGSPGVPVKSASDLVEHMNPGANVYVHELPGDPVAQWEPYRNVGAGEFAKGVVEDVASLTPIGRFVVNVLDNDDKDAPIHELIDEHVPFGRTAQNLVSVGRGYGNPNDEGFGAIRVRTDNAHGGKGHGDYYVWKNDPRYYNNSLDNMARLAVGAEQKL